MVIYELLSLHAPFASILAEKRNFLVKEGKRPQLQGKALWSPLMAQNIMTMCWAHEPNDRPTMKEVVQWVAKEEFSRLRAEVSIKKVESVSCACVCRITLDSEEDDENELTPVNTTSNGIGHISSITSAIQFDFSAGLNDMDPCTEYTRLQYDEASFNIEKNILPPIKNERGRLCADSSEADSFENDPKHKERSKYASQLKKESYSQVWLCDRKERGGLMEIFSYTDTQPSYLVS